MQIVETLKIYSVYNCVCCIFIYLSFNYFDYVAPLFAINGYFGLCLFMPLINVWFGSKTKAIFLLFPSFYYLVYFYKYRDVFIVYLYLSLHALIMIRLAQ